MSPHSKAARRLAAFDSFCLPPRSRISLNRWQDVFRFPAFEIVIGLHRSPPTISHAIKPRRLAAGSNPCLSLAQYGNRCAGYSLKIIQRALKDKIILIRTCERLPFLLEIGCQLICAGGKSALVFLQIDGVGNTQS